MHLLYFGLGERFFVSVAMLVALLLVYYVVVTGIIAQNAAVNASLERA